MAKRIQTVSLAEETRQRYLNYAMSVITSRALPDVRDGLKPVQRRILYTMGHDLKLGPQSRFVKSAKVVGQVMGSYHPHGDQAIYDAMVRLAQPFAQRCMLVWGQGNFGSLDGDPPAAMRYTEAKLQPISAEVLEDLKSETVPFRPSYDESTVEPCILPTRVPLLLVNGTTGIAVGMATSIPPHNLREIIDACLLLIERRSTTLEELLHVVQGPDLPTGGEVPVERADLYDIYRTGRGTVKLKGTWRRETVGRRPCLIIDSIPYAVQKSTIVEKIGELIANRKIPQALDVRDESTDDVRVVVELKQGAKASNVAAYLMKHTPLMTSLSFNLTCLIPTETIDPDADEEAAADDRAPERRTIPTRPERLGLKAMLTHFIDFRLVVVTRRLRYELRRLGQRIHILEGFAAVFDRLDDAIALIRRSDGRADAKAKIMRTFELDEVQTDAVLDTRIYKLAKLEIEKIRAELAEKMAESKRIRGLLKSKTKRWRLVVGELHDVRRSFGDDRRTRIAIGAQATAEISEEDFIVAEDTHVVVTREGWLKRIGRLKSAESTRTREGDAVAYVCPGSTRRNVVFFSSLGSAYVMRIDDVPATSGYGDPIQKYFKFKDGERVIGALSLDPRLLPSEDDDAPAEADDGLKGPFVLATTRHGNTLRFPLTAHLDVSQRTGRRFCRLQGKTDAVLKVELCTEDKEWAVVVTRKGRAIIYRTDEVSVLAGPGKGVRAIKLMAGDEVCAAGLSTGRGDALQVTTNRGTVHSVAATEVKATARGGKGRELLKRDSFVGEVPPPVEIPSLEEEAEAPDDSASGDGAEEHGS